MIWHRFRLPYFPHPPETVINHNSLGQYKWKDPLPSGSPVMS